MADLILKRHDTRKIPEGPIGYVASASDDADLSTALADVATVVSFIMRERGSSGTAKINAEAEVADAANRVVRYQWTGTDTDTAGVYDAEWEVKFPDGRVETFPTEGYLEIEIVADLDDAGQP